MVRTLKIAAITLMALGLLLVLVSTYMQEVQISSKRYEVELGPRSELTIRHKLNASAVYLRVSCSLPCDARVLVRVDDKSLGLNCTKNTGLLNVATSSQETISASIKIENYADSNRTVSILLDEVGSLYPFREFSIIGYFIWTAGFVSILIFVFRRQPKIFERQHKVNK